MKHFFPLLGGSLLTSAALVAIDVPVLAVAILAGLELGALTIYRLTQMRLQRASHETARSLMEAMVRGNVVVTVAVGSDGELRLLPAIGRTRADTLVSPSSGDSQRRRTYKREPH